MAEYIEREAAIAFMNEVEPCICCNPDGVVFAATKDSSMLEFLRAIPAADVVPVVRCKDCRKGIPDGEHATAYSCYGIWHKPDWFCAGGERKDGDEK